MSAALALKEFSPRLALPLAANDNDGQTIYTIYNRAGELVHVDDLTTGTKTDYVRLSGRTVARVENKITPTYVHGDHLGSPVSRSNASGTLLPRERYTPFGITLNNPNDLNNQAGFTATAVAFSTYNRFPKPIIWLRQPFPKQIKDSATGLNYMQARYYDPVIGRFLSIDPVTFMDTGSPSYFNRYRYCSNDPVNCTDPTGMSDAFGTTDSILFEVVAYAFQPVIDALDPRTIPDDIATTIDEVKRGDLSGAALSAGGVAFRPLKGAKGALKGSAGGGARAGKKHTRAAVRDEISANAKANGGTAKCVTCKVDTTPTTRRTRGSTVAPTEGQGAHIKANGGNGATVKDRSNVAIQCANCNSKTRTDDVEFK